MISEFELWLRSRTSKEKRPFHEETILANVSAITLFAHRDPGQPGAASALPGPPLTGVLGLSSRCRGVVLVGVSPLILEL
jgi:hypothetical protein